MLIAVARYASVKNPIEVKHGLSMTRLVYYPVYVWLVVIVVSILMTISASHGSTDNLWYMTCLLRWFSNLSKMQTIVAVLIFTVFPLIAYLTMVRIYVQMTLMLWRNAQDMGRDSGKVVREFTPTLVKSLSFPTITWVPIAVINLLVLFNFLDINYEEEWQTILIALVMPLNALANPFIYSQLHLILLPSTKCNSGGLNK